MIHNNTEKFKAHFNRQADVKVSSQQKEQGLVIKEGKIIQDDQDKFMRQYGII